mgnify:CR=1 FL=1
MEEYGLELLNERKGDVFSIVNEIFEFGSFLKGDEQENGNKEDKQENLKECIKKYNKVKKSEEKKKKILQYFCDALNKIVPDNKRYKIEEMEKIFSKIEIIYSLNIFQYHDHLKFMIALPLFDSYISKIDNFSDKWEDIISPLDLEIKSSSVKINGSSKSFFRNNQEKLDEILLLTDLKTIENWKKEKNLISTDSIYKNMCEYKKIYEVLSPEIKDLFSILYLKRIIWGIYHNNKESVKEFIRISFETIYLSSSNKISDEEKEKLFIKFLIDESQNVKEEEKELKKQNTDEIIIFDVPLLFESGIDKFCDKILVVISDYEIQLNRIVERDKIDRELAEKIIKSQLSNEERIKKADVVIENNSSLEDLFEKVERFCERI